MMIALAGQTDQDPAVPAAVGGSRNPVPPGLHVANGTVVDGNEVAPAFIRTSDSAAHSFAFAAASALRAWAITETESPQSAFLATPA